MSALGHCRCTVVGGRCRHFSILISWKEKIRWRSLEIKFNGRRRLMSDEEWKWNGGMQFSVRWNHCNTIRSKKFSRTSKRHRDRVDEEWRNENRICHSIKSFDWNFWLLPSSCDELKCFRNMNTTRYTCRWEWVDSLDDTTLLTTKLNHLKCDWGICVCVESDVWTARHYH